MVQLELTYYLPKTNGKLKRGNALGRQILNDFQKKPLCLCVREKLPKHESSQFGSLKGVQPKMYLKWEQIAKVFLSISLFLLTFLYRSKLSKLKNASFFFIIVLIM